MDLWSKRLPANIPVECRVHAPYEKFMCWHFVSVGAVFLELCERLQESDIFLKKHGCSRNRFNSHLSSPPSECPTFWQFLLSSSSGYGLLSDDEGAGGDTYKKQLIIIKSPVVRKHLVYGVSSCPNSGCFFLSVPPDWVCASEIIGW